MQNGFLKVAAKSPEVRVADCNFNADRIIEAIEQAHRSNVSLLLFPELSITAYSCEDLFLQELLLENAKLSLMRICRETKGKDMVVAVGLPLAVENRLYNCAAVMSGGKILGVVPKSSLPNDTEFYEGRYFAEPMQRLGEAEICGERYPFGTDILFCCREMPEFVLGVELCADLFSTLSPGAYHSLAGATVIANLSASDELVCKPEFRRQLVEVQSAKNTGAYVYCSAGRTESTDDVVFSGHILIAENGNIIAESRPFAEGYAETELDLERLCSERKRATSSRQTADKEYLKVEFSLRPRELELTRKISPYPFLPDNDSERGDRFEDILNIQCAALQKRFEHTRSKTAVIGVSGGLDSTLALLVAERTFRQMGKPATDIMGISMPCFGTTSRTKSNAETLCDILKVSFKTIDITKSVSQHLQDIGHDGTTPDVTLENAQARERTQVLMDTTNLISGLVIGTGDLSELALGWCTYNGDHMSMYSVNCSIPKTLVRHLVRYIADSSGDEKLKKVLYDIVDTPVSPELLPSDGERMVQKTEDLIGPYELHDFFLYYFVRYGFTPKKILYLAEYAFKGIYDADTIKKWLREFLRRFFTQQFKRTCVPNGPKVGSVSLSPRGDWRMPSDAVSAMWAEDLK
ncbi:MAG: NAD(+) synthase [Oscillospiraceae bacterium]